MMFIIVWCIFSLTWLWETVWSCRIIWFSWCWWMRIW